MMIDCLPVVSVCMITYNHESFIRKAIESILMQQCNFNIELVIGEDCSTDNTRVISEEYANRFKSIKLLPSECNQGVSANLLRTLNACSGKYIALCEGDDYWTDPLKLQKQVDFLEKNLEYTLSCHRYKIKGANDKEYTDYHPGLFVNGIESIDIDLSNYHKCWLTKTLTVVFKRDSINFEILKRYQYSRDVHLFYHILKAGKGICFNQIWGVYNVHEGGIHSSQSKFDQCKLRLRIVEELVLNNKEDIYLHEAYLICRSDLLRVILLSIFQTKSPFVNIKSLKYFSEYSRIFKVCFVYACFESVKMIFSVGFNKILRSLKKKVFLMSDNA